MATYIYIYEICEALAYKKKAGSSSRDRICINMQNRSEIFSDLSHVPPKSASRWVLGVLAATELPSSTEAVPPSPSPWQLWGDFQWRLGQWRLAFVCFFLSCLLCLFCWSMLLREQGSWNMVGFGCFFHLFSWLAWGERRAERRTWHDLCRFFSISQWTWRLAIYVGGKDNKDHPHQFECGR